ncbi:hypothetical protein Tco_1203620 [Tanacetum coccineum]
MCIVFLLPVTVINDINSLLKRFLWNQGESAKGKANVAWQNIYRPKSKGGLGLKDLQVWNEAMLAKHIWDIAIHTVYSNLSNTAYRSPDTAVEIIANMKVIKEGSKKFGLLKINDDSFGCNTPLGAIFNEFNRLSGMNDDLFTYEVEIPRLSSIPCDKEQGDDLDDGDLDVYEPRVC